jgi:hypothetical protein
MWVSQLAALIRGAVAARGERQTHAVVGPAKPDLLMVFGGHRGGDVRRLVSFADLADESKALAGDGVYEALLLAAVAHGAAGGVDAAGQR